MVLKLFKHQEDGIDFITKNHGNGALWWSMGLGKTLAGISVYKAMREKNPKLKLLVFCPISLINAAWGHDISRFSDLRWIDCHQDGFPGGFDVYICNYEMILSENNRKNINAMISANPFMCILDESSKIKNFKAKTTKEILRLRERLAHRIVMSATPAPNELTEYWPQILFVNKGVFHESFYAFRNHYFHLGRGNQKMIPNGSFMTREAAREIFSKGWKYEITPTKQKELLNRIAPHCHYARKEDCMDLPDQLDEVRLVQMGVNQSRIYRQMKNEAIAEIESQPITAQVALTKILKLRQITSGFAIAEHGEVKEIGENPKLNELSDVLEEAGNQQVIIWANFHHEINAIQKLLGDKATAIFGEVTDKEEAINDFKEGRKQYLIAHPRSAAHGLTFVNCCLQVFYSLDYSWESYFQAKGRTHRFGQVNKCTYVHILCQQTIDEHVYDVLQRKGDAVELVRMMLNERTNSQSKRHAHA